MASRDANYSAFYVVSVRKRFKNKQKVDGLRFNHHYFFAIGRLRLAYAL